MSSKKNGFLPGQGEAFRRPRKSPDDELPVRNMSDWGCDGDYIREPRYADRAFKFCSPVGYQSCNKITGIIDDILPPRMLGKQKFEKPDYMSPDTVAAAPGYLGKDNLTNFRDLDKTVGPDPRSRKKR